MILYSYSDVQTDSQCFNRTQSGNGFLGISHLSKLITSVTLLYFLLINFIPFCITGTLLPEITDTVDSQTLSIVFQPQLDNGLVLMLTDVNGSLPLLAVGLVNGEVNNEFNRL